MPPEPQVIVSLHPQDEELVQGDIAESSACPEFRIDRIFVALRLRQPTPFQAGVGGDEPRGKASEYPSRSQRCPCIHAEALVRPRQQKIVEAIPYLGGP